MKTLLLLILLAGCGQLPFKDVIHNPHNKDPRKHRTTDPAFEEFVLEFEFEYEEEIGDIPINFADLEGNKAGVCYTWSSGYAEIEINKKMWPNLSYDRKLALIFHELGHCELGRGHRDDQHDSDNCPKSIMNWMLVRQNCMDKYINDYLLEMFE